MLERDIQVKFRVNSNEFFQLKHTAGRAGLSQAEYIRRCVFSDRKTVIIDPEAVRDIYREMNHIGNNINQAVRLCNASKRIEPESIARLIAWHDEIKRIIDNKLGGVITK